MNDAFHSFIEIICTVELDTSFYYILGGSIGLAGTYAYFLRAARMSSIGAVTYIAVLIVKRETEDIEPDIKIVHMNICMYRDLFYSRAVADILKAAVEGVIVGIQRIRDKFVGALEYLRKSGQIRRSREGGVFNRIYIARIGSFETYLTVAAVILFLN